MAFASRIQSMLYAELDSRGVRQAEIGDALGLSQASISRRMGGIVPWRCDELEALAALAGLEIRVELVPAGGA